MNMLTATYLLGKGVVRVSPGQTLVFESPGGGGFGPPHDRGIDAIQDDIAEGLVSTNAAGAEYAFNERDET